MTSRHGSLPGAGSRRRNVRAVRISVVVLLVLCARPLPGRAAESGTTLFTFSKAAREPRWEVVNDGVMGGVSSSTVLTKNGVLRFAGTVRLENNGGFASSRSVSMPADADTAVKNASALTFRLRSSGSPFNITVETDSGWYWATVQPPARTWTTLRIPYDEFTPKSRFGEALPGASYRGQSIRRFGILIANKRAEKFSIELDEIGTSN